MQLWRLSNSGLLSGGFYPGGRWLPAGAHVVLLDSTPLAAICARLALVEAGHPRQLPRAYRLLEVQVPEAARVHVCTPPRNWRTDLPATRALGHAWLEAGTDLMFKVPTLAGGEQYLLNCAHPGAADCRVRFVAEQPFEERSELFGGVAAWSVDRDWLAKP
ncbi:hypothetical protein CAL15_13195 [Bordetella genomosp. 13]|uniref:RES domain-containing protein n=1 Tax=Bordetella genomosp. 13 TaxID=463040 RepID=A0A1W6ZCY9_9BORD|nr:hypothetical protein CAL15_13195 [Bordetella genomosp. 13]